MTRLSQGSPTLALSKRPVRSVNQPYPVFRLPAFR